MKFELALNARQQAIECLYPSLIDSARFSQSDRNMKKETKTLRASKLGVARLDFSKVDSILQIGDNIEFEQPMYIIVIGKSTSAEQESKIVVLSIDHEGAIKVIENHDLQSFISDVDPKKIYVDQSDNKVDKYARLILE